jgi:hypothetical protein
VPYFPLGGGRELIDQASLANVAARHQATTAQVALAWLLATSPVTLAIPAPARSTISPRTSRRPACNSPLWWGPEGHLFAAT